MAKYQFQSGESLRIIFPPFISSDGTYLLSGDVCTVVVKYQDGTVETYVSSSGGTPKPVRDANTMHWVLVLPTGSYRQGIVMAYATSSGSGSPLPQFREYCWGDYVNDIGTSSLDVAAIKAKTDYLPSAAGAALTDVQAVGTAVGAVNDKLGTQITQPVFDWLSWISSNVGQDAFGQDPALGLYMKAQQIMSEVQFAEELVGNDTQHTGLYEKTDAIKTDTAAVKLKTDNLPGAPAAAGDITSAKNALLAILGEPTVDLATDLSVVGSHVSTVKNIVTELQTIAKGHWKINGTQLLLYDLLGNVLVRFNLFDDQGQPTNTRIYERTPV